MIASTMDTKEQVIDRVNRLILETDFKDSSSGLLYGKLGIIVYLLSFYKRTHDKNYLEKIQNTLYDVLDGMNNRHSMLRANGSLANGMLGLLIVLDELEACELLNSYDVLGDKEHLYRVIYKYAEGKIRLQNFTYLDGPIACMRYLFVHKRYAEFFNLADLLKREFYRNNYQLYTNSDNIYIKGFNLGLRNGVLGVIKVLQDFVSQEGNQHGLQEFLNDILEVVYSKFHINHYVNGIRVHKPYSLYKEAGRVKVNQKNRLCWCNSDLTMGALLYKGIKRGVLEWKWQEVAEQLCDDSRKRFEYEATRIETHFFCHGSSGIAFLFRELNNMDIPLNFEMSQQYWIDQTWRLLEEKEKDNLFLLDGDLGAIHVLLGMTEDLDFYNYLI